MFGSSTLIGPPGTAWDYDGDGFVTDEEFARTFSPDTPIGRVQVAPRTAYGVARVQQEFGLPGSHFAIMGTAAHRNLEPGSPLAALLPRNALGVNGETNIRMRAAPAVPATRSGGRRG